MIISLLPYTGTMVPLHVLECVPFTCTTHIHSLANDFKGVKGCIMVNALHLHSP